MKKVAVFFLSALVLGMVAVRFFPDSANTAQIELALQSPSFSSWFGKDSLGRDVLARILDGAQVSVLLGLLSCLMAALIGVLYGAISALSAKVIDSLMMRICEVLMSLPNVMLMAVLALILKSHVFENNLIVMFWVLSLGFWMPFARLTRNLILQEKHQEYIEAAKAIGATKTRIFLRHMVPNLQTQLVVYWSLQIPHAILAEGLLSFLGFGIKSPGISWGALLQEGWKSLSSYPHLLLGPSLILFLTVLSLNILLGNLPILSGKRTLKNRTSFLPGI